MNVKKSPVSKIDSNLKSIEKIGKKEGKCFQAPAGQGNI